MTHEELQKRVAELLAEYAAVAVDPASLDGSRTLAGDLGIESLSLVSLLLRVAEELEVDLVALGIDLTGIDTVEGLMQLARKMLESKSV